jgi:hypothetical protein
MAARSAIATSFERKSMHVSRFLLGLLIGLAFVTCVLLMM